MHRSQLWGFEVSHIIAGFGVLAISNVLLNAFGAPLFLSWGLGGLTLLTLRIVSHGQKNGHLELMVRYTFDPHLFLGHQGRKIKNKGSAQ
jgi:hypothetical protein